MKELFIVLAVVFFTHSLFFFKVPCVAPQLSLCSDSKVSFLAQQLFRWTTDNSCGRKSQLQCWRWQWWCDWGIRVETLCIFHAKHLFIAVPELRGCKLAASGATDVKHDTVMFHVSSQWTEISKATTPGCMHQIVFNHYINVIYLKKQLIIIYLQNHKESQALNQIQCSKNMLGSWTVVKGVGGVGVITTKGLLIMEVNILTVSHDSHRQHLPVTTDKT